MDECVWHGKGTLRDGQGAAATLRAARWARITSAFIKAQIPLSQKVKRSFAGRVEEKKVIGSIDAFGSINRC